MPSLRTTLAIALAGGVFVAAAVALRRPHPRSPDDDAQAVSECSSLAGSCGAHSAAIQAPAPRLVGAPRMLVFSSVHCPACREMKPRLDRATIACGGERELTHVDIDTDAGSALATTYNVTSIPSVVTIDGAGMEVSRITGVQPQERIERALEEVRGVRCASLGTITEIRHL